MKKILTIFIILFIAEVGYSQQNNNVLLELCTGAWCQWCPCGDAIAETVAVYRPDALILAYHGPANTSSDPYSYFTGNSILSLMGFSSYPTGVVGRRTGIINRDSWFGQCNIQSASITPAVSYTVNRHYNPATRVVDMTVIVTALRDIDTNCMINFVITEDNLIYPQTGNSSCPGSSTWSHKFVVRNMVNGPTGESLNTGHWASGTTKTKTWTTTLDASWVYSNCKTGVFVYMQGGNLGYTSPVLQTKKESVSTFPTGIENPVEVPLQYGLSQNYPNPFNPTTNIHFTIEKDGIVNLEVYDILGNVVTTFSNGFMKAGTYNAEFNGANLASGVYLYKLTAGNFTETKKMMLVK